MVERMERDDRGPWMQTSLGGRWYPTDPRMDELSMSNIANGLATEYRYGGQADIHHLITVAEHTWKLWYYVMSVMPTAEVCYTVSGSWGTWGRRRTLLAFAMLLHDGSEGMGWKDMARAVKAAIGWAYKGREKQTQEMIWRKHGMQRFISDPVIADAIHELDDRIIANEYPVTMRHKNQPWAYRTPLPGIAIDCWPPVEAKKRWIDAYVASMRDLELPVLDLFEL